MFYANVYLIMAKTKMVNKNSRKWKIALLAGGMFLLLILIIQAVLITELYRRTSNLETEKIKTMAIEGVRSLESPPVINPATGKEYIPSARLVLPARGELAPAYHGDKDMVHFNERTNVNQAVGLVLNANGIEDTFEQIPYLQACSRQLAILFKQENSDEYKLIHSKDLLDGRTAYIYKNDKCQADASNLVEYIKNVESY